MNAEGLKLTQKDIICLERLTKGTGDNHLILSVFESLLLRSDFKDFIAKLRKKHKIPPEGYSLAKMGQVKASSMLPEFAIKAGEAVNAYREKIHVFSIVSLSKRPEDLIMVNRIIESYALFGTIIWGVSPSDSSINLEQDPLEVNKTIALRFPATANASEMIEFIKKNKKRIDSMRTKTNSLTGKKRARNADMPERNLLVFSRYLELKNDKSQRAKGYIEKQISEEMRQPVSENMVKKTITQMKKKWDKINRDK